MLSLGIVAAWHIPELGKAHNGCQTCCPPLQEEPPAWHNWLHLSHHHWAFGSFGVRVPSSIPYLCEPLSNCTPMPGTMGGAILLH